MKKKIRIKESQLVKIIKESIIREYNNRNYDVVTLPYSVTVKDNNGNKVTATLGLGSENSNVKYYQGNQDLSGSYSLRPTKHGFYLHDSYGQKGHYYFDSINGGGSSNQNGGKQRSGYRHWWDKEERDRKRRMNGHPLFGDYYAKDGHPIDPNTGKWSEADSKFNYLYDNGKYKLKNLYYHTLRDPIKGLKRLPGNIRAGYNVGQRHFNKLANGGGNFGFNLPQHSYGVK